MKQFIIYLLICSLAPGNLRAQGNKRFEEYRQRKRTELENYRDRKRKEFEDYRTQKNKEFAEYLSRTWQTYELRKGVPASKTPDPVKPTVLPIATPDQPPSPMVLPVKQIKDYPAKPPTPPAEIPLEQPTGGSTRTFSFYGSTQRLHVSPETSFHLKGCSEREVANAWSQLSGKAFDAILSDCQDIGKSLSLNDWGMFKLTENVSRTMAKGTNEAYVLQSYLLTQFGYDVRLCRTGKNRIGLLVPIKQTVCGVSYYTFGGTPFYLFGQQDQHTSVESYGKAHGNATRKLDLNMQASPSLPYNPASKKTFSTPDHADMTCTISVNANLMAYYDGIPQVNDWGYYASQPMDKNLTVQLYPTLQRAIQGKSPTEAATMLLNFVQKAFTYQTDRQQFGKERYNFGEENFFYPACDCEDRAILYSHLVRDLLGLDAVLLYYPNHLATAVRFSSPVKGDHVMVNGQTYTVCDPTYIGAGIGMCMPKLKTSPVEIIRIRK